MSTVFVDTSVLVALLDHAHHDHGRVVTCLGKLAKEDALLVTTSYVLVEISGLAHKRFGPAALKTIHAASNSMEIVWVDEPLHRRAWARAAESSKKGPGLVDWVGFLAMNDRSITTALTLDRHFKKQGFETLP